MELARAFDRHRTLIERSLRGFLEAKERELAGVNRWGRDLAERLLRFSLQGKMIRGGLVILAYIMLADRGSDPGAERLSERGPGRVSGRGVSSAARLPRPPRWVADIAAAYELIHSSLLVHDDIMDRDRLRRGAPTIFRQYEELGEREGVAEPGHFGTSLGICAGDVGFFLAFEMLSGIGMGVSPGSAAYEAENRFPDALGCRVQRILRLWAEELTPVGLAQMEDVAFGVSSRVPGVEEVLSLYRYKTARYTFSLPLATGAIAAGSDKETARRLEELGERLGILFQMKDDEIGLYGDEDEIGKPPGSDIKEGKKTLLSLALAEKGGREYGEIAGRVRNRQGAPADLASLRDLAARSGALSALERIRTPLRKRAEELIESLDVEKEHRDLLHALLRYNLDRTR
jgi:geranylgeranyl diphosphate synthase type I